MKQRYVVLILGFILAYISILVLLGPCRVDNHNKLIYKELAALKNQVDKQVAIAEQKVNNLINQNKVLQDSLSTLLKKRQKLAVEVATAKQTAFRLSTKYQQAKDHVDTVVAVETCDKLIVAHEEYVAAVEARERVTEEVIQNQSAQIDNMAKVMDHQQAVIRDLKQVNDRTWTAYGLITSDYNKLLKQQRWGKTKERVLAAAVIVLIAKAIIDNN